MPVKGRPRLVSRQANTTKLFVDDRREVIALSTSEKKCVSDVIRELVHEALRVRRFRAFGRDEGDEFIRNLYRETIAEGIMPVLAEFDNLRQRERAILDVLSQIFGHVLNAEHVAKVNATIAMQNDNLRPDEINAQTAAYQQGGALQARAITEKILARYGVIAQPTDANRKEDVQ